MKQAFAGRLFGPGLPGAGVAATARWEFETLCLEASECSLRAAAGGLRMQAAGFNDQGLRVAWRGEAGEYTFFLEEAAARATFATGAPARAAGGIAAAQRAARRTEWRLRLGWVVLAFFLLLPLVLLGVFYLKGDALADAIAERVPVELEAQIGELVLADLKARLRVLPAGPATLAVEDIGKRLTAGSRQRYQWFVVDQLEVNAFAAPGGVVVVFSGLLQTAASAEELAGVLAHEVAHVELRHGLKTAIKSLGVRALLSFSLGDFANTLAGAIIGELSELEFSREAEIEADRRGLRSLAAAGIGPEGMASFMTRLKQGETGIAVPKFLSTHPPSEERALRLRAEIAALPPGDPPRLAYDWPAVQASLGALAGTGAPGRSN